MARFNLNLLVFLNIIVLCFWHDKFANAEILLRCEDTTSLTSNNPLASMFNNFYGNIDDTLSFYCPNSCTTRAVVGTNPDFANQGTNICSAAAHAGAITLSAGGTFRLRKRPSISPYI